MNREFKFRVWDKKKTVMYYPDSNFGHVFAIAINGQTCSGYIDGDMVSHYDDNFVYQQFTGLKDKNGKEIYEGDIINTKLSRYVIEYDNKLAKFIGRGLFHSKKNFDLSDLTHGIPLGNIFENPELLL